MCIPRAHLLILLFLVALGAPLEAQVVINEIHYHPVEESVFDGNVHRTFDANGNPIYSDTLAPANYTDDIHEFLELYNAGTSSVDLSNWRFSSGVTYTFPSGTAIAAGGYLVIAKNPARIQTVYGITGVLGPYSGQLSNSGDTITLMNAASTVVDSVSYSASFPWAQSADGLGASMDWLGFDPVLYQYKGRSLERVSATASSNDPANWVASPLSPGPSPGAANSVTLAVPKPVVIGYLATQTVDGSPTIRANNTVTVNATFGATTPLSTVQLEYFIDDINSYTEPRTVLSMAESPIGSGHYSATIPGQVDRSIVRYRIKANRGSGVEVVSPRADDPQLVPVSASTREGWHAYFVTPIRTTVNDAIYDCFISDTALANLNTDISQSPDRRITPAGDPRAYPYVGVNDPQWDGVQPGIVVSDGVVYDMMLRYHGSRYRRSAGRQSYKWYFPRCNLFQGTVQEIFETDKLRDTGTHDDTENAHAIYRAAGIPTAYTQRIDLYINGNASILQLEQNECDDRLLTRYYADQHKLDVSQPKQSPGDVYKVKSTDEGSNGPYITFYGQALTTTRVSDDGNVWDPLHQLRWNVPLQDHQWIGYNPLLNLVNGTNAVWNNGSGDYTTVRNYLAANWDIDKMLTEMAIRNWCCPWDDQIHNHFYYRETNGLWFFLPWDFDYEFGENAPESQSIYSTTSNNIKAIFLTYYRNEYNQKLWLLNNTLLDPANLASLGIDLGQFATDRQSIVNSQLGLGVFQRPAQPVAVAPANASGVIPSAALVGTAYTHSSGNTTGTNAQSQSKWEIRRSDGTYADPVYAATSTTNLTSLPIPFNLLTLGDTYYWRVTYYDGLAHPSVPSAEASFVYGAGVITQTLISSDAATLWRYRATQQITASPSVWASKTFGDSSWSQGAGPFGTSADTLPEPIRTAMAPSSAYPTQYFRIHFNYSGTLGPTTHLLLRLLVDDGAFVYLNGQELTRVGIASTATDVYTTSANRTVGTAAYEPSASTWFSVPTTALQVGDNVLAASLHASSASSPDADLVFGLQLQAVYTPTGGTVAINEVCSANRTAVANDGTYPDYVELYNHGTGAVDLSGFSLTDDPLTPAKYVFPAGTTLAANSYLVVWCDTDWSASGLHTGFALDSTGSSVALYTGGASPLLVDFVTFGPQVTDLPIGRVPDGTGSFTLIAPSPGAGNTAKTLGTASSLRVNEWMADPVSGNDWFELYNANANPVSMAGLSFSDANSSESTQLPALSYIGGRQWQQFQADGTATGGNHINFKLSKAGDSIELTGTDGATVIDIVNFGAQGKGVSQGRLPDGGGSFASFPLSASPGASNWLPAPVVINEALTNAAPPLEDAIELYNPSGSPVSVGGWWLSDDASNPKKFQLASGVSLGAGAYTVLYQNQFDSTPGSGASFALSPLGGQIYLSAVDGTGALTGYRAQVQYGAATAGVSFGAVAATPQAEFWPLVAHTFGQDQAGSVTQFREGAGAANAAPAVGPVIINEVMYHPVDLPGAVDDVADEFVELHNITTTPQNVGGWKLMGGSAYTFPIGTVIRPSDYVLLVTFDPTGDIPSRDAFRSKYNLGSDTRLYGPYSPRLSNSSQIVELDAPGTTVGPVTPYVMVDRVVYQDVAPWPTSADGKGSSLQRVSRSAIGNTADNWTAATPTPGITNANQTPILDSDGDGIPDAYEMAHGMDKFDPSDALADFDGDGQSNLMEYLAGTDPLDASSVFKCTVGPSPNGLQIQFTAQPNKSYSVLYTDDLNAAWQKLPGGDVAAHSAQSQQIVIDTAAPAKRFYRVVTPMQ